MMSRRELLRRVGAGSVALALAGPLATPSVAAARVSGTITQGIDDRTPIKALIDQYFKTKYEGQRLLSPQDFARFTNTSPRAKQFVQTERDKREVELLQADLFGLTYRQYDYTLDFDSIEVDTATGEAVVKVTEGHDVVFTRHAPIVSKMRGIEHIITLQRNGAEWQIVEDDYADYMRRMIDEGGGKEAAIGRIRAVKQRGMPEPPTPIPVPPPSGPRSAKEVVALTGVWHPYDRYAAWNYARIWWNGRNPAYNNYGSFPGDDCTNYISQCIRGSGVALDTTGSLRWYSINYSDSTTWIRVIEIWDYLLANDWTGPYGVAAWVDSVDVGDLLQLSFSSGWGHCPIITTKAGQTFDSIYVAAHSWNQFDYPISSYSAATNWRFCKIQGWYD